MKKLLLLLVAVVTAYATAFADETTIKFSDFCSKDGAVTSVTSGDFTITFEKGGSTTAPTYYASGDCVRLYKLASNQKSGNTVTVAVKNGVNDVTINSVSYVYVTKGNNWDESTFTTKSMTVDASTNTAKYVHSVSANNYGIRSVTITYTKAGGSSAVAPTTITFDPDPASGPIDTNTEISLSADTDCKIYYAIDDTASEASILYTGPFTLSQGEHFVSVYAVNDAGYTEKTVKYNVNQVIEPTTVTATFNFKSHTNEWKFDANNESGTWISDDENRLSFPIKVGINDSSLTGTASGSSRPTSVAAGFRIYSSSKSYLIMTAPTDYYFVSMTWDCDKESIKIDGNTTTANVKSHTFSGKPTEFKINAVSANTTFYTLTIVLAKIETKVATPTFSIPTDSEVEVGQSVTISSATEGASLWVSVNGADYSEVTTPLPYTYTFATPGSYTIKAMAKKDGYDVSDEATATYTVVNPKVATPIFSVETGSTIQNGESVTISCTTEGATLMGNITGLDENGNTTIVNVNLENETIPYTYTFTKKGVYSFEVLASKDGFDESDVATADYTVVNPKVATPTFSVASGSTVEEGESVTINCATEGAKISGTVNDTAITDEELPYTYTFEKAGSYTIKVVASKADFDNSTEATATYTVTKFVAPAKPVFSVSSAQPTPSGTEVTISAEGATSLTVNTYGIDGYVAKTDVIEGNTATVTVDKMHRRFTAIANREANGKAAASEEVEAFYTIGNRTAATDNYTLVTSASELYDGMEFVMGVEGTHNVVMTTLKNGYDRVWYGRAATFANNEITSLPAEALILVLEKAADGNWNIRTKDAISYYDNADEEKAMRDTPRIGYFYSYALTTTSNYMQMSASPKASATIKYNDADGVGNATISFSKVAEDQPYMIIRYNTNTNGGFAMYMETESANSYPLPRIYAKKTSVAEDDGYKMSFHHTPYKANGSVQAKVVAATSHSNETVLNGTVNKDGTSYTFTTKEVQNLCGKFYVKIEKEELGGHISEAVVDFGDCNNKSCTAEDHSPFVHVGNKEEKKLVLAKHEDSVPLSTNPHGRLWLHTNPEVTVTLDPFRSIKMSLTSDKVTGVDDITVDSADAEVEYYNLQGIRVANPEHGIYIRRQGNTATKVRL